jgi:hypothetical protein
MPHRRPRAKGSFGGHFDELTKHFPHEEAESEAKERRRPKPKRVTPRQLNRFLLDDARRSSLRRRRGEGVVE